MRFLSASPIALAVAVVAGPVQAHLAGAGAQRAPAPGACERLAVLALPDTRITSAVSVAAGSFTPPTAAASPLAGLPAFCRIAATLTPTSDSEIRIEVWMPASGWNEKFQAVGNGGWSGGIAYSAMAGALERGYATSSTDTGHTGGSASFALGHPEKLVDFGYRSVHEMTVRAKALIAAFYGNAPKLSYWRGCSAGGRQGLKEAQQFPDDYDGIIAGAPAADWTGRAATSLRVALAVRKDEASHIPREKYALLHAAVLDQCDGLDGVKDGVLENPRRCRFDPAVVECKGGADPATCLTPPQVATARQIYAAATNPRTRREITGLEPGSEPGWATWGGAQPFGIGLDHFRYVVFRDPAWDVRRFNFDTDVVRAEEGDGGTINALDPNLKAFFSRGGKLLQYHGWSDPQISPGNSVQYYQRVVDAVGGADTIGRSYRLFMVPGMAHCSGGDGPASFDAVSALERWVEQGVAPDRIEASRVRGGRIDRTRPLCPYPQVAAYRGTGSTDEAANFACVREGDPAQTGGRSEGRAPASGGLDHVNIAVADLERAAERYRAFGFALKPGRPHDNGIRNQHVKFPDGTEIELITAPAARDALTSTYRRHIARGDGPAFLALYAPDRMQERPAGLPYIFFGPRNESPTDRPEHFAHANSAESLVGVWLAGQDLSRERRLLESLGATMSAREVRVPDPVKATVASVPDGRVLLLPRGRQSTAGRTIVGATVRVRSLADARAALRRVPDPVARAAIDTPSSLFLPPSITHGIWLELCECR